MGGESLITQKSGHYFKYVGEDDKSEGGIDFLINKRLKSIECQHKAEYQNHKNLRVHNNP